MILRLPRWPARLLALGFAVVALLWLGAPAAHAHTFLVGSNPADGQVLDVAPTVLRLDFSESVVLGATQVSLTDGHGATVSPTSVTLASGGDGGDTEQPVQLAVALPDLPRGTYRVAWKTLSADDMHQASGVLAFGVGEKVGAAGAVDEAPGVGEAVTRWVMWSCLAGLLGPLVVAALAGGTLRGPRRSRLVRLARGSGVALVAAAVVLPAAQLRSVGEAWQAARAPGIGGAWALRVVGAGIALALVGRGVQQLAERGPRSTLRRYPAESAVLAAGLLVVPVVTGVRGHIWSTSHLLVAADVLHMVAGATWVGAVAALAIVHAGRRGLRPVVPARAFALLSVTCVAVAVATGFLLAGHGVATTTALLHARYGVTVLVKGALIGAVLLLALRNHRQGRGDGVVGASGRRWVAAEAALLVSVLAAAGALAATSPANSPQWTPGPSATRSLAMHADDLLVQVSIGPNAVGPAYANVSVLQTRRPAPAAVHTVRLTLRRNGSTPVTGVAEPQPDGTWALPLQVPESGAWGLTVEAQRTGLPVAMARGTWVVAGGVHGPDGAGLSSLTTPAAALVVLGWLALLAFLRRSPAPQGGGTTHHSLSRSLRARRPARRPRPTPHPSWPHRTSPETVSPHSPGGAGSSGGRHDTGGAGSTDHPSPAATPT
ncbi:MAG TPA: copper resistance protein CopC [Angustibacter sp.]|nr:copper resistance protein CopC [Angustibacter sp.]